MFERLMKYLCKLGIDYEVQEKTTTFDFQIHSTVGKWNCLLSLQTAAGIGFYSTLLSPVPRQKHSQMALFLMYLNNQQLFGNFELDLKTGDVRFKTYLDLETCDFSEHLLDRTMLRNVTTMERYFPQIMNLITAA
jgi:Putative bacterial sensory transduction regulator